MIHLAKMMENELAIITPFYKNITSFPHFNFYYFAFIAFSLSIAVCKTKKTYT
jgi:hypothetical protein